MTSKKSAPAKKPASAPKANKAMVETPPKPAAKAPPVDKPVTLGAVTTTGALAAADVAAPETVKGSRDERHDSINPHTGALTDEALALRAERAKE